MDQLISALEQYREINIVTNNGMSACLNLKLMKRFAFTAFALALMISGCGDKPKPLPPQKENKPVEQPAKDSLQVPPTTTISTPKIIQSEDKYFLVAGSFLKRKYAEAFQSELEGQGYQAQIVQRSWGRNSEYFRVAYKSFQDKRSAFAELEKAQHQEGKTVWLLVK